MLLHEAAICSEMWSPSSKLNRIPVYPLPSANVPVHFIPSSNLSATVSSETANVPHGVKSTMSGVHSSKVLFCISKSR